MVWARGVWFDVIWGGFGRPLELQPACPFPVKPGSWEVCWSCWECWERDNFIGVERFIIKCIFVLSFTSWVSCPPMVILTCVSLSGVISLALHQGGVVGLNYLWFIFPPLELCHTMISDLMEESEEQKHHHGTTREKNSQTERVILLTRKDSPALSVEWVWHTNRVLRDTWGSTLERNLSHVINAEQHF